MIVPILLGHPPNCDGDGIINGDELTNGTDPYLANVDTDGDGFRR
ncbi:hypothetical protein [Flagellimonas sp.]